MHSKQTPIRWLSPDAAVRISFENLQTKIAETLNQAADVCASLRCFTLPKHADFKAVEIIATEGLIATIMMARETAAALLKEKQSAENFSLITKALFLISCLTKIYDLVLSQDRSGDA